MTELHSYKLGDLGVPDVQAYLKDKDIIMIPLGALEQHGPHLPLGTDAIQAEEVTVRAANKAKVLYTPCVWMGYSPQHMYAVGGGTGTITIRPQVLLDMLYDIARSLVHHGFKHLVFVNNQGSNAKIIDPLLRKIRYDTGAWVVMSKLYGERYMGLMQGVMENPPEETPGWHSSELETSQIMAHNGGTLVHMERAAPVKVKRPDWFPEGFIKLDGAPDVEYKGYQYFLFATEHSDFTPTGVIGNPMRASAEKGKEMLERYSDHLAAALDEFQKVPVTIHDQEFRERV